MAAPVLVTKLYAPPPRPGAVPRPRLTGRLDAGLHRRLTLVSAPAGFGKTTLVAAWVAGCGAAADPAQRARRPPGRGRPRPRRLPPGRRRAGRPCPRLPGRAPAAA